MRILIFLVSIILPLLIILFSIIFGFFVGTGVVKYLGLAGAWKYLCIISAMVTFSSTIIVFCVIITSSLRLITSRLER